MKWQNPSGYRPKLVTGNKYHCVTIMDSTEYPGKFFADVDFLNSNADRQYAWFDTIEEAKAWAETTYLLGLIPGVMIGE